MKPLLTIILLLVSWPVLAQTTISGPITFGDGLTVKGATVSLGGSEVTGTFVVNTTPPPNPSTSWMKTVLNTSYQYLPLWGQVVASSNFGQMAIVGAARSSDSVSPGHECCPIGLAGVAYNDNAITPQSAWPIYATMSRLHGTGNVQVEIDITNVDTVTVDINPYRGPTSPSMGTSIAMALQSGGEPVALGVTPITSSSAALWIGNNGSTFRHGIVFDKNVFDPALCTENCPAIDLASGQEIRWAVDNADSYGAFIRANNFLPGTGSGLLFNQFGPAFERPDGRLLMAISGQTRDLTNVAYPLLGSIGDDAAIAAGSGNGATNANLVLSGLGGGTIKATLPGVAGAGGVYICVDAAGLFYKKASCP